MCNDYLENLPLSLEEKKKIVSLGASNAAALLAMMQAAPEVFDRYLGTDCARELAAALEHMISESERAVIEAPVRQFHATGAIVDQKAPLLRLPKYEIAERDRLFDQLQRLRQQANPSPATKRRIAKLEQRLNSMLNGA